jgi:hypothetical protein
MVRGVRQHKMWLSITCQGSNISSACPSCEPVHLRVRTERNAILLSNPQSNRRSSRENRCQVTAAGRHRFRYRYCWLEEVSANAHA